MPPTGRQQSPGEPIGGWGAHRGAFQWNRVLTLDPPAKLRAEVEGKLKSVWMARPGVVVAAPEVRGRVDDGDGFRSAGSAKVNLFLHVGARGADGYHPIRSLVTFADIGDRLALAWRRRSTCH